MTGGIFISYRRDDSAGEAGRLHDRLEQAFGRERIFMDVDALPLGQNFIKVLEGAISNCDVCIVVIGRRWVDIRDGNGHRRLDDPNDFVRIEVATALRRRIPLVPILLEGAPMPSAAQLPPELSELPLQQALSVRHTSFHTDLGKLIGFLDRTVNAAPHHTVNGALRQAAKPAPPKRPRRSAEEIARLDAQFRWSVGHVALCGLTVIAATLLSFIPLNMLSSLIVVAFMHLFKSVFLNTANMVAMMLTAAAAAALARWLFLWTAPHSRRARHFWFSALAGVALPWLLSGGAYIVFSIVSAKPI